MEIGKVYRADEVFSCEVNGVLNDLSLYDPPFIPLLYIPYSVFVFIVFDDYYTIDQYTCILDRSPTLMFKESYTGYRLLGDEEVDKPDGLLNCYKDLSNKARESV